MSDTKARDVLAEAYTRFDWQNGFSSCALADAGLAALRAKGFAVVRTADVESVLGWALAGDEHTLETDRLKEAIR